MSDETDSAYRLGRGRSGLINSPEHPGDILAFTKDSHAQCLVNKEILERKTIR